MKKTLKGECNSCLEHILGYQTNNGKKPWCLSMGCVEDTSVNQTGMQMEMEFCVVLVLLQLLSVIAQSLKFLFYGQLRNFQSLQNTWHKLFRC